MLHFVEPKDSEDDVVDMDEVSKSPEVLDETDIEESDAEPDSELEDDEIEDDEEVFDESLEDA